MRTAPKSQGVPEILASAEGSFAFVLSWWRIAAQSREIPSQVPLNSSVRPFQLLKTCIRKLLKCSWRINLTAIDFTESVKPRPSLSVLWSLEHQPFPSTRFGSKQLFRMTMGWLQPPWIWQMWVKEHREIHYLAYRKIIQHSTENNIYFNKYIYIYIYIYVHTHIYM